MVLLTGRLMVRLLCKVEPLLQQRVLRLQGMEGMVLLPPVLQPRVRMVVHHKILSIISFLMGEKMKAAKLAVPTLLLSSSHPLENLCHLPLDNPPMRVLFCICSLMMRVLAINVDKRCIISSMVVQKDGYEYD